MTDDTTYSEKARAEPADAGANRPAPAPGYSLASLMLVVTLISLICGLSAIALGLGMAAAVISLPAFARTTIVLRHAAAAGAIGSASSKLAAFGTSCCIAVVVAIAAGACGFAACWVTGYPSAIIGGLALSPFWPSGGDPYAPMMVSAFGVGATAGSLVAVFLAYRLFLLSAWFPVPRQDLSRRERRFFISMLILTAVATSVGVLLTMYLRG